MKTTQDCREALQKISHVNYLNSITLPLDTPISTNIVQLYFCINGKMYDISRDVNSSEFLLFNTFINSLKTLKTSEAQDAKTFLGITE